MKQSKYIACSSKFLNFCIFRNRKKQASYDMSHKNELLDISDNNNSNPYIDLPGRENREYEDVHDQNHYTN